MSEPQETIAPTTTPEASTAPVETPNAAPAAVSPEGQTATPPPPDAYTPDYGYRFQDKTHEIDEFWRPLIKDKDTEAKVRDVMQRAQAVESYKTQLQEFEGKLGETSKVTDTVQALNDLYNKGDHERVLEQIGYTDEMLYKIVAEKIQRAKMPEDQKRLWEEKRQTQLENERLQRDTETARARYSEEITRTIDYQLTQELGKPEYQSMIKMYEGANGEGSFRKLVIDRGAFLGNQRGGVTIPPHELIPMVSKEFQPFMVGNQTAAPVVQRTGLKVVPNVGAGNASPAKQGIKSIDDLRKRYNEITSAEE